MTPIRSTASRVAAVLIAVSLGAACSDNDRIGGTTVTQPPTSANPATAHIEVDGTTLYVERRGTGDPLLLIHGAGEDAGMLTAQAESLAAAGFEVITYDRRGTGRSGRDDWPGSGARQHADDAAALLDTVVGGPATVVGLSSGGVIALELAARHPDRVGQVVAWEPPAAGVVPGGPEIAAGIMAPVEQHLATYPGDFVGAQAILLTALAGFPVTVDDPALADIRANAEAMVRDDPAITLATITADDLRGRDVIIAVGSEPNDLIAAAIAELAVLMGREPVRVTGAHEIYFTDPSVLTGVVADA